MDCQNIYVWWSECQGYEVFKSSDGGITWDNWAPQLDNINVTNIEHQEVVMEALSWNKRRLLLQEQYYDRLGNL